MFYQQVLVNLAESWVGNVIVLPLLVYPTELSTASSESRSELSLSEPDVSRISRGKSQRATRDQWKARMSRAVDWLDHFDRLAKVKKARVGVAANPQGHRDVLCLLRKPSK